VKDVVGFECVNMQIGLQTPVWTQVKHAACTFSKMDQKKRMTKECLIEGPEISFDLQKT